jgi:cytochrome c biogenesis protein CcdA
VPAVFGAGVLVGLCTVPCSGAIYLAVLGLLAAHETQAVGYAYLVLYNLLFVLPLVALLGLASSRPVVNQLGRWQLHHRAELKGGLGVVAVLLGMMLLITL